MTDEWKRVLHNHNFAVLPFRLEMYKTAAICVLVLGPEILAQANIKTCCFSNVTPCSLVVSNIPVEPAAYIFHPEDVDV